MVHLNYTSRTAIDFKNDNSEKQNLMNGSKKSCKTLNEVLEEVNFEKN